MSGRKPCPQCCKALGQRGWRDQQVLVVNAFDARLDFVERECVRRIGERLYGKGGCVMANLHTTWTMEDVAARFDEDATIGRRLPPVRVQGYFNTWPAFVRKEWEAFAADEKVYRPFAPSPEAEPDAGDDALGAVAGGRAAHLVWMGQALRLARHHDPICLRPHYGVAALAEDTPDHR
ncbi:MAG TPA: DUF6362 family protein [Rhodocyclaceae bacterium]|nr:DUF6362 family protein [Rhodocyclaceae bacterium]